MARGGTRIDDADLLTPSLGRRRARANAPIRSVAVVTASVADFLLRVDPSPEPDARASASGVGSGRLER